MLLARTAERTSLQQHSHENAELAKVPCAMTVSQMSQRKVHYLCNTKCRLCHVKVSAQRSFSEQTADMPVYIHALDCCPTSALALRDGLACSPRLYSQHHVLMLQRMKLTGKGKLKTCCTYAAGLERVRLLQHIRKLKAWLPSILQRLYQILLHCALFRLFQRPSARLFPWRAFLVSPGNKSALL